MQARSEAAKLNDLEEAPRAAKQRGAPKAPSLTPPPKPSVVKSRPQDDGEETAPSQKSPPKPTRPKDLADWKSDDYFSAKHDGDPRLPAAVMQLGERTAGKESTAELLTKLLESPATEPLASSSDDEDVPHPGSTTSTKLTQAILAALAANGTPQARQTLENLVTGASNAAKDQNMAAALKALLGHAWPAEEEAALRIRLANHMIKPETPQPVYDQLWTCLKEPRAENLPAQIVLFQSDRPDKVARAALEQLLAEQSAGALGRLLGLRLPRNNESRGRAATAIAPDRLAEQLWSPDCAAAIERRLHSVDVLNKAARLVTIAGTIPEPSLRAALLRTLQRHWDEGPQGLESLVAPEGPAVEPGFLVLVKMLPRKDAGGAAGGKDTRGRDPNRSASQTKSAKLAEFQKSRQLHEETAQHWMKFSHDLVRTMCERFCSAARAEQAGGAQSESEADDAFPVKLHPNADVVAFYRLDWPDGLSDKIAAAPSLRVRYVRLELKAQPSRAITFYRRQLPDCEQRESPSGVWLDSLNAEKKQSTARSVDVLVTKVGASASGIPDREQELTVDILSIECARIADRSSLSASR